MTTIGLPLFLYQILQFESSSSITDLPSIADQVTWYSENLFLITSALSWNNTMEKGDASLIYFMKKFRPALSDH